MGMMEEEKSSQEGCLAVGDAAPSMKIPTRE